MNEKAKLDTTASALIECWANSSPGLSWVILCKHLRILVRGYRHHQATGHRRTLLKGYFIVARSL